MINTFIHSRYSLENQNPIPDQNGAKTLPDGAAHTYIGHIREYLLDISQGLD